MPPGVIRTLFCAQYCVSGGNQRQRTHSLYCVFGCFFFPTVSEDVVQMPSYVLHLVRVSLAGARGVLWYFIRALDCKFFGNGKVLATRLTDSESRRAVQGDAAFHAGLRRCS